MGTAGERIVSLLQAGPLTTSQIIEKFYTKEFQSIKQVLEDSYTDRDAVLHAKRRREQLHRRVLYHINKLVSKKIIEITRVGKKGEKQFCLRAMPFLDGSLREKKLQAALVNLEYVDKEMFAILTDQIKDAFGVIGLERIEEKRAQAFVEGLEIASSRLTITVFLEDISLKVLDLLRGCKLLNIVLAMQSESLSRKCLLVKEFCKEFSTVYIQNTLVHKPPFLVGERGVFTITAEEWKSFLVKHSIGLCYSQMELVVEKEMHYSELRKFLFQKTRSIIEMTTAQRTSKFLRKVFDEGFLLNSAINHLRVLTEDSSFLRSCKEQIKLFCESQQQVFASCGLPTRFSISLSGRPKKSLVIIDIMDVQRNMDFISKQQELCSIFDQQYYLPVSLCEQHSISIIQFLLTTCTIPLIQIQLRKEKNSMLTSFM